MYLSLLMCHPLTNYVIYGWHINDVKYMFIHLFISFTMKIYLSYKINIKNIIGPQKKFKNQITYISQVFNE